IFTITNLRLGSPCSSLQIGRVPELVFRPRHFQLDAARVVRVACRSVVVVNAGIDRDRLNALTSMVTFFVPMPRNPPTLTTMPIILPVPSNSRSLTEPIRALSGPSTSLPLNFVNTHWSAPCEGNEFSFRRRGRFFQRR